MKKKDKNYLLLATMLTIVTYVLVHLFYLSDTYSRVNDSIFDSLFRITRDGDKKKTSEVAIIAIDDLSLNMLEENDQFTWPWPRNIYGFISDYLLKNGAKAVVFDIVFNNGDFDREKLGITGLNNDIYFSNLINKSGKIVIPLNINDLYESKILPEYLNEETMIKLFKHFNDEKMRNTLRDCYTYDDFSGFYRLSGDFTDKEARETFAKLINSGLLSDNINPIFKDIKIKNVTNFKYVEFPYSIYAVNTNNMGFVENATDDDGIIRDYKPVVNVNGTIVPSLALSAYIVANNKMPHGLQLDKSGNFTLNWYGPGGIKTDTNGKIIKEPTITYYSAYFIFNAARASLMKMEQLIEKKDIDGKVFFVGNISRALLDQKNTPFTIGGNVYPGVETHATAYLNMKNNDYVRRPNFYLEILLYLLPIFFMSFTGIRTQSSRFHIIIALLVTGIILFFQVILFTHFNVITNVTYFLLLAFISVIVALTLNYIMVGRNRNLIKNALGTYISPALEKEITASGKPLSATGESVEATAMFIDIAGFTTFSEKNTASEVVKILNIYLNHFSEYIMNNSGFVNKFLGDGLMALFGTITPLENHADLALKSAVECLKKTNDLNSEYGLDIRIGINSGDMIKGNMGGVKRLEFTAIGDNVNLASRLEGANKFFGTNIILGENSYNKLKDKTGILFLGKFCVKGKAIPIGLYAYSVYSDDEKNQFSMMLDAYYGKDREKFENLIKYFNENHKTFYPAQVYIENYKSNPETFGLPIKFNEK